MLHNAVMKALEDAKDIRGGLIGRCSDLATLFKQSTSKWELFKGCQRKVVEGIPDEFDELASDDDEGK